MKVLMFGSGGFIGHNVSEELRAEGHEVVDTYRNAGDRPGLSVDLLDPEAVGQVLEDIKPDVIVNCAGVVKNNEEAEANPKHTDNILAQVVARHLPIQRMVVLGSAAEYGIVDQEEGAESGSVHEDTPLQATAPYGRSKIDEVARALVYREEHGLPIVVARAFNPVGPGMPPQQLVPRILGQIKEIEAGGREEIEVSRLDSERDYVDVRDLAGAIALLAVGPPPRHAVYNIGSGKKTSNGELVRLLVRESAMPEDTPVKETADKPEPAFASQSDNGRIKEEYGWEPKITLEQTVKDIVEGSKNVTQ